MRATLCFVAVIAATAAATELVLKRVGDLPLAGSNAYDRLLLFDTDHDGLGEVIHNPSYHFQIAEYAPVNRYAVVLSDTSHYPWPESTLLGSFLPFDVGDVDRDGRTDMVGYVGYDSGGSYCTAICIFESRDSCSYPDSAVWRSQTAVPRDRCLPSLYADLDGDSAWDIVTPWGGESTAVFENVGNNRESLVGTAARSYAYSLPTVGDFDLNGRTDYTFGCGSFDYVIECAGDNRYALVCSLYTGFLIVNDRFSGRDVDRNGRPEYFEVAYKNLGGLRYSQTLCQFEATAEHEYSCDTVDTASSGAPYCGQSLCADVDGDSLEEIIWGCGGRILVLEATGPHQYERVCDWHLNGLEGTLSMCNAADFNGNGYREIFVGGNGQSFVLEVECIRVLCPDTNRHLRSGDTCEIRWQLFQPPRCDSVSLFLRTDTTIVNGFYRLDTIATGLSPSESTYSWVVPDTTLDSAWIVAIAYGPGWQFDESDRPLAILPSGVADAPRALPASWLLAVGPNPARGALTVSYAVPRQSRVSVGVYDTDGKVVKTLRNGFQKPGVYTATWTGRDERGREVPKGVYFYRLDAPGFTDVKKAVLVR
jgi:hypothetical protein